MATAPTSRTGNVPITRAKNLSGASLLALSRPVPVTGTLPKSPPPALFYPPNPQWFYNVGTYSRIYGQLAAWPVDLANTPYRFGGADTRAVLGEGRIRLRRK